MHEVAITMGMIDELTRIAMENNAGKVVAVNLKIGKMSGIVTDSLKFAFDTIKLEYPLLSSAKILIEEVPLTYECTKCKSAFSPQGESAGDDKLYEIYFPACPDCKSRDLTVLSGEEMKIEKLEVEV